MTTTFERKTLFKHEMPSYLAYSELRDAKNNDCIADITDLQPDGKGIKYVPVSRISDTEYKVVNTQMQYVSNNEASVEILEKILEAPLPRSEAYASWMRLKQDLEDAQRDDMYLEVSELKEDGSGGVKILIEDVFDYTRENGNGCFSTGEKYWCKTYEQYTNWFTLMTPAWAPKD